MYNKTDIEIRDNRIIIKEFTDGKQEHYNWATLITLNPQKASNVYNTLSAIIKSITN